ncbi:hypothetical protein LOK74_00730 [Brevibacillus humidisoli]|uniref:hypothetical protein n=1 Tax=Brevibacillus humidisoli TaxID=2895522 RepID=UPI001E3E04A4|nr:hypothetical protein [Brevibacillus humidisoli]UFJ41120.1 hypothetical protein LOK74_00730 [Brevibacillus humidisoli]
MLIIFGAIFLLVGIVSLVITRDLFGTMVALFILILLLVQIFLSIFWFASLGEKWEYAEILDRAERVFATAGDEEAKQEISVELLYSARGFCWRDCSTEDYRNLFMVKNHLDQPVQAELKILAANERKQQLAMYESLPIDLQPGEYRVVVTEETNLEDSVWDRWTSYTDEKIAFFQYQYRYEPIK